LPIAARKGRFQVPAAELACEYREACRRAARAKRDLEAITAEYERHIAFHNYAQAQLESDLNERIEYLRKVEAEFDDRTNWALELESEKKRAITEFERVAKSDAEAWEHVATLEKQLQAARAELARLQGAMWTRAGRKLRALD
jgi:septation ring formation regulator EzrA